MRPFNQGTVIELVKENGRISPGAAVNLETTLGDADFDSLDIMEFVMDCEAAFDVEISDTLMNSWGARTTINTIYDDLEKLIGKEPVHVQN